MPSLSSNVFWMALSAALALLAGGVHSVACAVGFYRLRKYPDISNVLFSEPLQIPARVGLLRISFYWPRRLPDLSFARDAQVARWLRTAQMSGSAVILAFLALVFVLAVGWHG
jgi:hypothetical protein